MRSLKQILLWVPTLLWYGLIWAMSAQPAAASDHTSDGLTGHMLENLSPSYTAVVDDVCLATQELLSFFIRKCAHMFLFFVLALLIWLAVSRFFQSRPKRAFVVMVLAALLAILDEYHQTLVPGRSGELRDVLVDLTGVLIALTLFALPPLAHWLQRNLYYPWVPSLVAGILGGVLLLFVAISPKPLMVFVHRAAQLDYFVSLPPSQLNFLLESSAPILRDALYLAACGITSFVTVCLAALSGQNRAILLSLLGCLSLAAITALFWAFPLLSGLVIVLLGILAALLLWKLFPWLAL